MAEKNLNIQKVKDNTSLSRTTISNLYNNNGSGVQFETLSQLCNLLNCQPGDIFTYYDVSVDFKEIANDEMSNNELDLEALFLNFKQNQEIINNKFSINILCKIEFERERIEFEIEVHCYLKFKTDEYLAIDCIVPKKYQTKIDSLNMPFYAENYIKHNLVEFIMKSSLDEKINVYLNDWGYLESHYDISIIE
ncbi:helix-turn-helix domain-containing protein [Salipaludibacillus sp. CF4.18]|uniref:helix-turn-helix domain-containing protein n=1 Tax=Salipaludibacillus sp. CF4.18 TaxID=3373081 RepID=UPI003EE4CCE6